MGWEREIHLCTDTGFGTDLGMLIDVVRIANKVDGWEELIPTYHQQTLKYIYLVDYLSPQMVLNNLAALLGIQASKLDRTNPRGKVNSQVWNAYWMAKYMHKRQLSTRDKCRICRLSLIPAPPNLPPTFQLPCCKTFIHKCCRINWAKGPACDTAYTAVYA